VLQVNPQLLPSQVAAALLGGRQPVHDDVPQLPVLPLETQAPLQMWNPLLQVNPQLVPSHVDVEFPGTVHEVHEVVPQLPTLVLV